MSARVVCIVGPTASGKSRVADMVAHDLGSSVVSVDAMQVYRGMDIGTAKTPPSERNAPLLMVDVCDPGEDYSVQRFQADARACVDGLIGRGCVPVLCGGTGLYLDAVIDEMDFPSGDRSCDSRSRYESLAEELGPQGLWEALRDRDRASAELIHPNNVRRVVRALELHDEGVSYAQNHEGLRKRAPHYQASLFALAGNREALYRRIDARVDEMFSSGLVEEVRALVAAGISRDVTAGQAIGYKEVLDALEGLCTMDEARATVKARTRRYAKRQLSWLRRDGRAEWLDADALSPREMADAIIAHVRAWEEA